PFGCAPATAEPALATVPVVTALDAGDVAALGAVAAAALGAVVAAAAALGAAAVVAAGAVVAAAEAVVAAAGAVVAAARVAVATAAGVAVALPPHAVNMTARTRPTTETENTRAFEAIRAIKGVPPHGTGLHDTPSCRSSPRYQPSVST
ncbi:MAG: hypothetical protein ACR2JW_03205, partial [Thermomicrobiales bacterium]